MSRIKKHTGSMILRSFQVESQSWEDLKILSKKLSLKEKEDISMSDLVREGINIVLRKGTSDNDIEV